MKLPPIHFSLGFFMKPGIVPALSWRPSRSSRPHGYFDAATSPAVEAPIFGGDNRKKNAAG